MAQTKEEKAAYTRAYYERNRERLIAKQQERYYGNHEEYKRRRREQHANHREERNAQSRAWYQKNKHIVRERQREQSRLYRFTKHGLTESQYLEMVGAQNGVCGICHDPCPVGPLCIDHDHKTGHVRGLLCRRCNAAIGLFREKLVLIELAVRYLQASTPKGQA